MDWDEEVIAQMSVVASVFASAYAKKTASDAVHASDEIPHLFEDSPIGIALLDSGGQCACPMSLWRSYWLQPGRTETEEHHGSEYPGDMAQTWLHMQEVIAGARATMQTEKRFCEEMDRHLGKKTSFRLWERKTQDGPYLWACEDVTETNLAREQLDRFTRMLTLALEARGRPHGNMTPSPA